MEQRIKDYPVIIDNSHIEFALMGPVGRHRGVIVKSKQASPDLIGYDNPYVDLFSGQDERNRLAKQPMMKTLWTLFNRPRTHVIRSYGAVIPGSEDRKAHYTFVWKGICEIQDLEKFETQFEGAAADLNEALKSGEVSEIEWLMSGLIASCSMMQDRSKVNRNAYRFGILFYFIFILLMVVFLFRK